MVSHSEILASNALLNDATAPRVAVFVGATSGIGKLTLHALVATGASTRIYLVGRQSSFERTKPFIDELHALNPRATIIWTEGEYSLLSETRRICNEILAKEQRIDLLFLTAGYAPMFTDRVETEEGIEITQSLAYYSRILFVLHLLPALKAKAEVPGRVITVLGGGLERVSALHLDDIDLKRPGNFAGAKAQAHYLCLNSVALDKLAEENPDLVFVHAWPGWVNTGNVNRGVKEGTVWAWFVRWFLGPLIGLVSIRDEVAAQRYLFEATSACFGGAGVEWKGQPGVNVKGEEGRNGLFLVNFRANCTPNLKVMSVWREKAREGVWEHTMGVLRPYF
ncbi:short chain dehydrogenase/reductase family protein [Cercophora newfieldiana]|uniref:Short chain dehydrogenase/reductase family protein n=1 Tax=Cercophora newfieldiana TaxID=92897 RepID=A0AA39Y3S5_9PEZI|nr:short chain dehydrogenase/reductase family protein [Cercophora newfieldiana]